MILADTSVWVDHLRRGDARLMRALDDGEVLTHPMVIGELACGTIRNRAQIMELLAQLPGAHIATDEEAMVLIDERQLMGRGIGWIDVHLLASTLLTSAARLWTRDSRLAAAGGHFGIVFSP